MQNKVGDVCFIVEGKELRSSKAFLAENSPYFKKVLQNSQGFKEIRITPPEWVTVRPFEQYLKYLETKKLPETDILTAEKLLWIADFFKDYGMQGSLINKLIVPQVTKDTALAFVHDASTKLQSTAHSEHWQRLYFHCLHIIAKNAQSIFAKYTSALEKLNPQTLEEIIRATAEFQAKSPNFDTSIMMGWMKQVTDSRTNLELLINEERRALSSLKRTLNTPQFEWTLNKLDSGNFYVESESFEMGEVDWQLCVWSFEHESRLEISLKLLDSSTKNFPKNSLVGFSFVCQINDERVDLLAPKTEFITAGKQSLALLRSLQPFKKANKLSIKFFAKVENLYSSIFMHIAKTPQQLLEDYDLKELSFEKLTILLNYKFLSANTEDEIIEIVGKWTESQTVRLQEETLNSIVKCVKWQYASIKGLFSVIKSFPLIKNSSSFREALRKEIETRSRTKRGISAKPTSISDSFDDCKPRFSYKDTIQEEESTPKLFFEQLTELILGLEPTPQPKEHKYFSSQNSTEKEETSLEHSEKEQTIKNLNSIINQREQEIKELKERANPRTANQSPNFSRGPSPLSTQKVYSKQTARLGYSFLSKTTEQKVRNLSMDAKISNYNALFKPRKAGQALGALVSKLKSRSSSKNQ